MDGDARDRHWLIRFLAAVAGALGAVALLGWALGRWILDPAGAGRVPMAPSTAVLILLLSLSIVLRTGREPSSATWGSALTLILLAGGAAGVLLPASLVGRRWEVEHLGFDVTHSGDGALVGHISPLTAAGLLLVSISLLASVPARRVRTRALASWVAAIPMAGFFTLLVGYLFGEPLLGGGELIPPAASTSLALLLLCLAAFGLAVPEAKDPRAEEDSNRWLLLIFVLFAAGVITVGVLSYRSYGRRFRQEAEARLTAIADLKAYELVQYRRERLEDGLVLFRNPTFSRTVRLFRGSPEGSASSELAAWMERLVSVSPYVAAFLLDPDGKTRLACPVDAAPVAAPARAEALLALRSRRVSLEDFYRSEHDGLVYLGVVVPVLDVERDDEPLGVLALRIDARAYLDPFIARWPNPSPSAETLLVRPDGAHVLFLNALRFQADAALTRRLPLHGDSPAALAARGVEGIVSGRDYRGRRVLASVRDVPGSPWFLVAKVDEDEVDATLSERQRPLVALVVALLVGAGGLAAGILRRGRLHVLDREVAAERERAWLHRLVSRSLNEVYVFESESSPFRFVNDGAIRSLGYAPEDLGALTPADVVADLGPEGLRESLDRLRRGEIAVEVVQTTHRRKDGSRYDVEVHLQRGEAPAGPVFLAFAVDVTARRRAEAEIRALNAELEARVEERTRRLAEVNQELATFAYSVSHDLKAPLRGIEGYSQLLVEEKSASLDEEGQGFVRRIREGVETMARLIDDLLAYSRMERRPMQSQLVDLRAAVASVAAEQAEALRAAGADLRVDLPPLAARADPQGVQIVLRNLLSNALKFGRPGRPPVVEIGGLASGGTCRLWVKDDGIGFDMKYHDRIFELFQRLQRAEDYPGTGVGLALVRRAMTRMNGRVWAESAPGAGATFILELPHGEP